MLSKAILVIALILSPSFLVAKKPPAEELEARAGDVTIRIAGKQCINKVILDQLKPEYKPQFKKAEIKAGGKTVAGCWIMAPDGVFLIFEDGEQGYVPPEMFKPVETL